MEEKTLKVEIELHVVGDGRTFLNFWNWKNGDDVIAELKNGKLYLHEYKDDEDGKDDMKDEDYENYTETEVSLDEFVNKVKTKF